MSNDDPGHPRPDAGTAGSAKQADARDPPPPSGMRTPVHPGTLTLGAPLTSTSTPVLQLPWALPHPLPASQGAVVPCFPQPHPTLQASPTPNYPSGPAPLTLHLTLNSDLTWAELCSMEHPTYQCDLPDGLSHPEGP